jgi:hypothetical protein
MTPAVMESHTVKLLKTHAIGSSVFRVIRFGTSGRFETFPISLLSPTEPAER